MLCLCYPLLLLLLLIRAGSGTRPPMSHWAAAIRNSTSAASPRRLVGGALTADDTIQALIELRRHREAKGREKGGNSKVTKQSGRESGWEGARVGKEEAVA